MGWICRREEIAIHGKRCGPNSQSAWEVRFRDPIDSLRSKLMRRS